MPDVRWRSRRLPGATLEEAMLDGTVPAVAVVFVALALIFTGVLLRDFLCSAGRLTPARKVWPRSRFIFSSVAIGLFGRHASLV